MSRMMQLLAGLARTALTFAVLVLLGIVAFYVTVFVVSTGAGLAGYDPSGDFVVLSASLLVVAALLGGIPLSAAASEANDGGDSRPRAGFE